MWDNKFPFHDYNFRDFFHMFNYGSIIWLLLFLCQTCQARVRKILKIDSRTFYDTLERNSLVCNQTQIEKVSLIRLPWIKGDFLRHFYLFKNSSRAPYLKRAAHLPSFYLDPESGILNKSHSWQKKLERKALFSASKCVAQSKSESQTEQCWWFPAFSVFETVPSI